jgi:hypothetical protein
VYEGRVGVIALMLLLLPLGLFAGFLLSPFQRRDAPPDPPDEPRPLPRAITRRK